MQKCGVQVCFVLDQSSSMQVRQFAQEKSFVVSAVSQLSARSSGKSRCESRLHFGLCRIFGAVSFLLAFFRGFVGL